MSILHSYDPERAAILEPGMIVPRREGFPAVAVSAFDCDTVDTAARLYGGRQIAVILSGREIPVYEIHVEGKAMALYQSSVGGPASAAHMEEVIAMGAGKFVFFGACGVLDQAITDRGLILPTAAYRDEGTSYHYLPAGDYVEIPSHRRLAEIFDRLRLPYLTGKTWTTDAIYRETRRNMQARRAQGCVAVEMECASLMAVAAYRGVEAYQFLYSGDNLDADQWEQRDLLDLPADARERFIRIAMEVALRI